MKLMKTLMIAGALMISAQAANANDVAEGFDGRLVTIVKYDDLNLSAAADADALYGRLSRAADTVCVAPATRDLKLKQAFDSCRARAMSAAVADVNHPNLSQKYFARTGKQVRSMSVASLR